MWLPGRLPFFVSDMSKLKVECPEHARQYATRVDEHVPIFTSQVKFTHGAANPVAEASGGSVDTGPAAIPSAIRVPEMHPAELRAKQILSSGSNVSCRAVRKLFDLVEKEPAPRGDRESLSLLDFFGWVEFLDLGLLLNSFLWLPASSTSLLATESLGLGIRHLAYSTTLLLVLTRTSTMHTLIT